MKYLVCLIGLLSIVFVSVSSGSVANKTSPLWYMTETMKVKAFTDSLFPEQVVDLNARNDKGQPVWTRHCEWADGAGIVVPQVDSSSTYLYRVISSRFATNAAVHMTYDDGIEVWLNGQKIASNPSGSPTLSLIHI